MPIVRIDISGPVDDAYATALMSSVREGVTRGLGVPDERVTIRVFEAPPARCDLPAWRSDRYTVVDVTLFEGRDAVLKTACSKSIRDALGAAPGIPEDEITVIFRDMSKDDLDTR